MSQYQRISIILSSHCPVFQTVLEWTSLFCYDYYKRVSVMPQGCCLLGTLNPCASFYCWIAFTPAFFWCQIISLDQTAPSDFINELQLWCLPWSLKGFICYIELLHWWKIAEGMGFNFWSGKILLVWLFKQILPAKRWYTWLWQINISIVVKGLTASLSVCK